MDCIVGSSLPPCDCLFEDKGGLTVSRKSRQGCRYKKDIHDLVLVFITNSAKPKAIASRTVIMSLCKRVKEKPRIKNPPSLFINNAISPSRTPKPDGAGKNKNPPIQLMDVAEVIYQTSRPVS